MPAKRKRVTRRAPRTTAQEMMPAQPYAYPYPPQQQPNRLLYGLLILNILFTGFMFYKLQGGGTPTSTNTVTPSGSTAQASTNNALQVTALKKDAKDLGLDTNKFNKCLDNEETKNAISADVSEGSSLGVQGTPGFFINGRFLAGAFPFENFKEIIDAEISGTANGTCDVYSDSLKSYCSTTGQNGFNPVAKQVDAGNAPMVGSPDAKVTIVEFSDFECPFCQRAFPTVKKILSTYPNDVKLYYKQFPLTQIHPDAQRAALAAECANQQGKFWQYHDKLFESQGASAS